MDWTLVLGARISNECDVVVVAKDICSKLKQKFIDDDYEFHISIAKDSSFQDAF